MEVIRNIKKHKIREYYLDYFLNKFWFIPSDALQRSIEANIWSLCKFITPVLEIGIGNGQLTNFLFKNHPQIEVGIDIEESGLELARKLEMSRDIKRYKKVMRVNAEKMPFKQNTFNTVISNSTFEHIDKDTLAIAEVARVLKKDGLFFLTVPSEYLPRWILEYEKKEGNSETNQLELFNTRAAHLHYHTIDYWSKCFNKHNMKIIFHQFYFPKNVSVYWYKLFRFFTQKIYGRELWSYLGQSKLTKIIPKKVIIAIFKKMMFKNVYLKGFITNNEVGGQLFMVARKI